MSSKQRNKKSRAGRRVPSKAPPSIVESKISMLPEDPTRIFETPWQVKLRIPGRPLYCATCSVEGAPEHAIVWKGEQPSNLQRRIMEYAISTCLEAAAGPSLSPADIAAHEARTCVPCQADEQGYPSKHLALVAVAVVESGNATMEGITNSLCDTHLKALANLIPIVAPPRYRKPGDGAN